MSDVVELDPSDPRASVCGECGRGWDDSVSTAWTPTPAGRCPFEYEHDEGELDEEEEDAGPWCEIHGAPHEPGNLTCELYAAEGRYNG